jgi:3-oxoisoapionate decarboxylase
MELGLSTYTYTWSIGVQGYLPKRPMTALDLLARAHLLGIHLVQIADNLPLDLLSRDTLDEIDACARDWGISIEVGMCGIAPEHLRRFLDLAKQFRSSILRLVIDTPTHHPSPEETVERLYSLHNEFERAGIILAIENHDRFPTGVLAKIVHKLGDWAGICLDTVNSFGALEGPRAVLDILGPLTVNLHIKDFTIFRPNHKMGFTIEGRPAGQGKLDIPWLLNELKRYQRDPNAILEQWTPRKPDESLDETIAREHSWAAESVIYLRKLIPV